MDAATLTVREDGPRAVLSASCPDDGRGLYKAWLWRPEGRFLLGTMVPEGKQLVIRRTLSISELRRCGVWPPEGVEAELSFSFGGALPQGWRVADGFAVRTDDQPLGTLLRGLTGALVYTDRGGYFLAAPFSIAQPFPLPALFCFAAVEQLGEAYYAIFCFDREGRPCFTNKNQRGVSY